MYNGTVNAMLCGMRLRLGEFNTRDEYLALLDRGTTMHAWSYFLEGLVAGRNFYREVDFRTAEIMAS